MKAICQLKETSPIKYTIIQVNFEFHEPVIGHYIFFAGKYFVIKDIIYQTLKQSNGDYVIPNITIACNENTTAPVTEDTVLFAVI